MNFIPNIHFIPDIIHEIKLYLCYRYNICYFCLQRKATWFYGPANESLSGCYCCNECVPRGCSCNHCNSKEEDPKYSEFPPTDRTNWKWIDEEKGIWTNLDEKGRELPCCEWFHFEENLLAKDKIAI
jgi:hypothetical protein